MASACAGYGSGGALVESFRRNGRRGFRFLRNCNDCDQVLIGNALVGAPRDRENVVRNNPPRALAVMAISNQQTTRRPIKIPLRTFIEMLNSVEWTDRNKSSVALDALTYERDPAIL